MEERRKQIELETIRRNHDEAYLYVSQALSYEEQGQFNLAREKYKKALVHLKEALSIKCIYVGQSWDSAREMQQKMRNTTERIRDQLQTMPEGDNVPYVPPEMSEVPPSYDEACSHEILQTPHQTVSVQSDERGDTPASNFEVIELFCVSSDVQLFYVSIDGSVTTSATPTSLVVYQFVAVTPDSEDSTKPSAWLQVGSWIYPLIPGQSPAFETSYGAFLFPNVGAGRDSAVGIILPSSVNPIRRREFQELLNKLTSLLQKEEKPPKQTMFGEKYDPQYDGKIYTLIHTSRGMDLTETFATGIVTAADYLSTYIVKGASLLKTQIHSGAGKVRERIQPNEQQVTVDPRIRDGLIVARRASGLALQATGYLVKTLGDLAVKLGRQLTPYVKSAFSSATNSSSDTIDGLFTVAASGVQGLATVYVGLESAAKILAYSLSTETVKVMDHKYGSEVGEVVENALFSIGNTALSASNVHSLGPKSIAKKTAKNAGKTVLQEYVENSKAGK